jgi:CheY-like chemotaxis protein
VSRSEAARARAAAQEAAAAPQGPRVLVVDDDEHVRLMLRAALHDAGFDAREAAHGADALAVVQHWRPDVILLDLVMPWMNGYEFAGAYRQQPGPHAPIILVTAVGRDTRRAARELGAEQVVAKPFDVGELLKLVGYYGRYLDLDALGLLPRL